MRIIVRYLRNGQRRKEFSKSGEVAYDRLEWVQNAVVPETWVELREYLRVWVPEVFSYGRAKDEDALRLIYTKTVVTYNFINPNVHAALETFFRVIYQLGSDLERGDKDLRIIMDHIID